MILKFVHSRCSPNVPSADISSISLRRGLSALGASTSGVSSFGFTTSGSVVINFGFSS